MGDKKFAKNPLLYITQPDIKTPKATMQYNYKTPKKNKEAVHHEKGTEPKIMSKPIKRKIQNRNFKQSADEIAETDTKEIDDSDVPDNNKEVEGGGEEGEEDPKGNRINSNGDRPKFKDMRLKEKVEYLASTSPQMPKMRCEIKTKEKTYRGVIASYEGDTVFIRSGRRTSNTEIPFDDIEQIRMLGF